MTNMITATGEAAAEAGEEEDQKDQFVSTGDNFIMATRWCI